MLHVYSWITYRIKWPTDQLHEVESMEHTFIISFKTAHHWFLLWDRYIQSTTTHPGSLTSTFLPIFPSIILCATYLTHLILFTCFQNDIINIQRQRQIPTLKTSERWVANMFWSTQVLWFRPSACSNTFRTTPSKFCKLSNCDATCNIKIMHFSKCPMLYPKSNLYKLQNILSELSRTHEMCNCLCFYRTVKWLHFLPGKQQHNL